MTNSLIPASSHITASAVRSGRWKWLAAALSACALLTPAPAQAGSLLSLDFDSNSGFYFFGFAFGFYGDADYGYHDLGPYISQENGISGGAGFGGSNGLRMTVDASQIPAQLPPDHTYEGFGFAIVEQAGLPTLTSPRLSDYTFTLSGRADGLNFSGTAQLDVSIFAPDGTLGAMDGNLDTLITLRFANGIALGSTFQDSAVNFANASSIENGSTANFANFYSVANEISFSAAPNDTVNTFGYDAGNAIVLDNMNLSVAAAVPEASSFACVAAGVLALLTFRRRRTPGLRA